MVNISKNGGKYQLLKCLLNYKKEQKFFEDDKYKPQKPDHKPENGWLLAKYIIEKHDSKFLVEFKETQLDGHTVIKPELKKEEDTLVMYKTGQGNLPNEAKALNKLNLINLEKFFAKDRKNRDIGNKSKSPNIFRLKRDQKTFDKLFHIFLKNGEIDYFRLSDYAQDLREYYPRAFRQMAAFKRILRGNEVVESDLDGFVEVGGSHIYWYYLQNPSGFKRIIKEAYKVYEEQGIKSNPRKYWYLLHGLFMSKYFQSLCEKSKNKDLWHLLARDSFHYLNNIDHFKKELEKYKNKTGG